VCVCVLLINLVDRLVMYLFVITTNNSCVVYIILSEHQRFNLKSKTIRTNHQNTTTTTNTATTTS
jgi:hypothetical protein